MIADGNDEYSQSARLRALPRLADEPIVEPLDGFATMFAFYEPTAATCTPATDNSALSQVLDLSGNTNTLTQATVAARPYLQHDGPNGHWRIDMLGAGADGGNNRLEHTGGVDGEPSVGGYVSAFAVARSDNLTAASQSLLQVFGTGYAFSCGYTLGNWITGSTHGSTPFGAVVEGQWMTIAMHATGSEFRCYLNGVLTLTVSDFAIPSAITRIRMGNTGEPPISVASMALCGVESESAVREWHRYVRHKFGLSHVVIP